MVAALAALIPVPEAIVERWYSRGLYPRLQPLVTRASSITGVAVLDVAAALIVVCAVAAAVRTWRGTPLRIWVKGAAGTLIVSSAAVYLWFLAFWGLNYRRLPLEQKLAYDQSRVGRDPALQLAQLAVDQANGLVMQAQSTDGVDDVGLAKSMAEVERWLGASRTAIVAQPKRSLLTWYFRNAAIDGMTDPFFLEIILNPDLLPSERPFTLAHEWAHLAGYADESEANFIAWLACVRGAPEARYSGWLAAYQYLAAVLPRDDRKVLRARLSPAVSADLAAASARVARANPTITRAARGAYDSYLRANRIEEGIANYGVVARLMLGTSFDSSWRPQLRPDQP